MAIPEFSTAGIAHQIDIGSYVRVPITLSDGEIFGTLCGPDPDPRSDKLLQQRPLLNMLGMLLSKILHADLERTRQARKLERVERTADSDGLTGLLNRRGWDRDRLRDTNETHGHQAGDDTIKIVESVIRNTIRDTDIAARLGGDEFGIIATDVLPAA
jgi:diguanylate cyclase